MMFINSAIGPLPIIRIGLSRSQVCIYTISLE